MIEDLRLEPRRTTDKSGVILLADGKDRIKCQICNLSSRGAKIETEHPASIPNTFILVPGDRAASVRCQVLWRIGRKLGVIFIP